MDLRTLLWIGGFLIAAGLAAGCSNGASVPTPAGDTGTIALSPSASATALALPVDDGVTGTFSVALGSNFPSGVAVELIPLTSGAPAPEDVAGKTLAAPALASWEAVIEVTNPSAVAPSQTIMLPSASFFSLSGLSNPSKDVVEIIDPTGTNAPVGFFRYDPATNAFSLCSQTPYTVPPPFLAAGYLGGVKVAVADYTDYVEVFSGTSSC